MSFDLCMWPHAYGIVAGVLCQGTKIRLWFWAWVKYLPTTISLPTSILVVPGLILLPCMDGLAREV